MAVTRTSLCLGSGLSKVRNRRAGNDVRNVRLWRHLLGVDGRTVIEDIEVGEGALTGPCSWWPECGREARYRVVVGDAGLGHRL